MMFSLKLVSTVAILTNSILILQAAIAFPKVNREVELDYIEASYQNIYGEVTPEIADYLEQQYDAKSSDIQMTLDGGYKICNGIELANDEGVSSQSLIEREIAQLNLSDGVVERQGISLTKEQIILIYNTAKNNLCPELE